MAPTTTAGSALTNLAPSSGATYFEFQVDRPVTPIAGSPQPSYPDSLKRAGVEGQVLAAFVVDTTGHVVVASLKVLKATNPVFAQAVRDAIPGMLLTPATVHGRKVKQLVQQPFVFATAATNRVAPTAAPKTGITPPGTVLQFDTMIVVPRRAPGSP
jgi:TonB family protein